MDANDWNKRYETDEYIYSKDVNKFVAEFCGDLPAGTMIDVAGGEGRNSVWFAERGWRAENVDFSGVALAKFERFAAERGVAERCHATEASALDFVAAWAPADLGVVAYLQVPDAELRQAIANLVAQLKPGATFFGVWHALENLALGNRGPQDPLVLPTVASLTDILAGLPVEILDIANHDGHVKTVDGLKPSETVCALARKL